jgi:hypothetical protein
MKNKVYGGSLLSNTPVSFDPIYLLNSYGDCIIECPSCHGKSGSAMIITHTPTCSNRSKTPNIENREQKCLIARNEFPRREAERLRIVAEEERRRLEEQRSLNEERLHREEVQHALPFSRQGGYRGKMKRKTRVNRKKNRKTRRR